MDRVSWSPRIFSLPFRVPLVLLLVCVVTLRMGSVLVDCGSPEGGEIIPTIAGNHLRSMQFGDLRLTGGTTHYEGFIEIYSRVDGEWHTHCDSPITLEFYEAVCRILGFGSLLATLPNGTNTEGKRNFTQSSFTPLKGYFVCNAGVTDINSCLLRQTFDGECGKDEHVGIVCSGAVPSCSPIPLQNPRDMEIPYSQYKSYYPVNSRVHIVCKATDQISSTMRCVAGHWETDPGEEVHCPKYIDESIPCPAPAIDTRNTFLHPSKLFYKYGETFGVVCRDRSMKETFRCGVNGRIVCADVTNDSCIPQVPTCVTVVDNPSEDSVVLVGGNKFSHGRIRVKLGGEWGSICADEWDQVDANVVCNQLGYGPARELKNSPRFPIGDKKYLFSKVSCSEHDTDVLRCTMKIMTPEDKCASDFEAEVDCHPEEIPCQPPHLPENNVLRNKYQPIYRKGETVTIGCRSGGGAMSVVWTCNGAGSWDGYFGVNCKDLDDVSIARDCGPPVLPPNAIWNPQKFIYEVGEEVTAWCIFKTRNVEPITLTCASDGLWRGETHLDCGTYNPSSETKWIFGVGMLMVMAHAIIFIVHFFCVRRARRDGAEARANDPPPNDDRHGVPANQQPVPIHPQVRRAATDKED